MAAVGKKLGLFRPQGSIVPTEHQEQASVVAWARSMEKQYPELTMLYAVPNGAHKSPAMAQKFKREGLVAGVPDLVLASPRAGFHGLYIEMKRVKGSTLEPEQRDWLQRLSDRNYAVAIARGADAGIAALCEYLGIER